jgi:hypothetical protein
MRKVKNITVCVTPEIYREARHLAAEYDSTVSTMVAWLLPRMRVALERSRFPKGGPKPSTQPAPSLNALVTLPPPLPPTPPALTTETCNLKPENPTPGGHAAKLGCETVTPPLTNDFSAACSHSADPVTATVQLYSTANEHIKNDLPSVQQNAIHSL